MSRSGSHHGLLDGRHASRCEGQDYSACRPVVVPAHDDPPYYDHANRGARLTVVLMVWCGECTAADWAVV